ncbi:TetR/AcrR family transcriptional regulator [Segnochrobactrum spirostomi]|uniref:TetR/AcrR family transcriptional regulator n=1 Tax=Segnochrobactrum spirostomi TaxID=2608987 RepID=A0A6A7Y897_9HYPH|nr:TetR/AcrR family transcriptional regulator [Segnochrobactrum spirostomi]MQT14567.1 TetR/AcrR family transcriptional regulator [Segnochrobactrum spirostomi]
MARHIEFDADAALCAAMRAFGNHGYEGTSTSDLLDCMGIARQSLYGTFGDKRRLFLKALERYNAMSVDHFIALLAAGPDRLGGLEAALTSVVAPPGGPETGCLRLASIAEFGHADPDIHAINEAAARVLLKAIASHLRDGVAAHEIADVDVDDAAHFLLTFASGLKVAARAGDDPGRLRSAIQMALRLLRP